MRLAVLLLLLPCQAWALFGFSLPEWLDKESRQLAQELNRGVGQSQNPNFLRAEYQGGVMSFYYKAFSADAMAPFGAVVEDQTDAVLRGYCQSGYYRKRLDAGLVYRHIYEGPTAPPMLTIRASSCQGQY
ncbi:hypothetical protein Fbal_0865 [Ferrimonas balearica DSM 9799]|uniref:Uncharacterized protein n=1 Tax=Ferrimonas balearica (strain DSM 9799 / CCM 4581 / KCTC 23876 / PAT) TaxID=550540 RepID=E1ST18_FERBD|nr:hypothetical protein [Ferrimonas balearica]ADN75074.1 hypothetical protein Fbal_0865 [Ferrimonas balearica DSM 9799]MBW3137969.1 hypothetical protein [Ferrimonas balearica]MBW3164465.1 hypothetical protein [Ferrimonas balearica]MBY5978737.1 hypothetical protein [Ferrimonas balearica]MBY6105046.1 hypothetical protein [Ferrimonas balearica]